MTRSTLPRRTFLVDHASVVASGPNDADLRHMASLTRMPAETFRDRYWAHRPAYLAGVASAHQYWNAVADRGWAVSPDILKALVAADSVASSRWDPAVVDVLRGARASQHRVVICTASPADIDVVRVNAESARFDVLQARLRSAEASASPNELLDLLARSDVQLQDAVLVDARPAAVVAAAQLGINAFCYTGSTRFGEQVDRWIAGDRAERRQLVAAGIARSA